MECKFKFCLPERKFSREKADFLKGRRKVPNEILSGNCDFHLLVSNSCRPFELDRL